MILKELRIFSQNVRKSNLIVKMILEVNFNFDIIFIQEPSWTTIRSIPSSVDSEGVLLVRVVNHLNWLTFARESDMSKEYSRVTIFINIRLALFHSSFHKDIINHRDILFTSFFVNNELFWIMNIYFDSSHSAIKYLKDMEINICNLLIITGDFNIHNSLWDPSFPHHSSISDDLIIIADSFNLNLLMLTNHVPTRYSNNNNDSNSVIDLMFLQCSSSELDNHTILSNWWLTSDHAPLTITIPIAEANIDHQKWTIIKNSEEEELFIKEVITSFAKLDMSNILEILQLENVINDFTNIVNSVWMKHSKVVNITKYSKSW